MAWNLTHNRIIFVWSYMLPRIRNFGERIDLHYIESLFPEIFLKQIWVVWGSNFLSNALSENFWHYIQVIYLIVSFIVFLLICRGENWPVKTHFPASQIIYKRYQIGISTMNILNMSFNATFPWRVHPTANAGPVWLSQLISPCLYTKIMQCYAVKHHSILYTSVQLM